MMLPKSKSSWDREYERLSVTDPLLHSFIMMRQHGLFESDEEMFRYLSITLLLHVESENKAKVKALMESTKTVIVAEKEQA